MTPAHLAGRPPFRGPVRLALATLSALLTGLTVTSAPAAAAAGAVVIGPATGSAAASAFADDGSAEPSPADYDGPVTSANARFVVAGYQHLVGREPDTTGLDFHLGRIAAGGHRGRLGFTYALLFSAEGAGNEVTRAYGDILGRSPDPAGAAYWTTHLQGHSVADLRVLLYASDEYVIRAGGHDGPWLARLYLDALGRPVDPAGHDYWLARRQAGVPRILVAAAIHQSDEALARRAVGHYQEVLGRTPSEVEVSGTVATLRAFDDRMVRARMFASDEVFETYLRQAWIP